MLVLTITSERMRIPAPLLSTAVTAIGDGGMKSTVAGIERASFLATLDRMIAKKVIRHRSPFLSDALLRHTLAAELQFVKCE